jgi:hypothetical protein
MLLGAILGSALGTFVVKFFPSLALIKENLTEVMSCSLEIVTFSLNLNISAIIGMIVGIFIFTKI